ncbi:DUF481 domain-containing protein [Verrucomicrobia bacterium]|jgi:putative salt-induced outer membrane protein YdiY|nr:DUF481 domain-containing protein [Verrucomicrobiota bacterium]MDA7510694.1 DUF481 domain-containing protein [Verrucomicrobiota bacterium]MDA7657740.1 DUF481 domain-containing protein [Verrucomicrobiota bacterium]
MNPNSDGTYESNTMSLEKRLIRTSQFTLIVLVTAFVAIQASAADADVAIEEKPKWETSAAVGFTLTSGNSDTVLGTASLLSLKKWELHELSAGLNGSYGEVEGVKNNELARGTVQYNRLLGDTDSYFFGKADLLHDSVADVEYRLSLSPGYGYYFTKNDKTKLSAEIGPGYIFEKLGSGEDDYLTLRVGERFEYKISDRARLWQSVEFMPQIDEFTNYLLVAEIGVESDLTEKMSLRVSLQDNYDNQPAPGRKSNDLRLVTGIGYKF